LSRITADIQIFLALAQPLLHKCCGTQTLCPWNRMLSSTSSA
jgi:hypothetical protein